VRMNTTEECLIKFYTAFAAGNAEQMNTCYHRDATFHDPAFGHLDFEEVKAMWKMLISRSKSLSIEFEIFEVNENHGAATWVASYPFGKNQRSVVNHVHSSFEIENGLILKQRDKFDLWKWSRQALGTPGLVFGWTPSMKKQIQSKSKKMLARYMSET